MIAVIDISNNFSQKLDYHAHKMHLDQVEQRAVLLESTFVSLDKKNIEKEVRYLRAARPRVEMYTYHTSISFHPSEELCDEKMLSISKDYMERSGLHHSQHMIFRHHDTEHPHVHLLANMINYEGEKLNSFQCYKNNMKIVSELERKYDLMRTVHEQAEKRSPSKQELEMVIRSGKPSEKMVLQEMLDDNLKRSEGVNDFVRQCNQQNIEISFWKDQKDKARGITFFYEGMVMRGSALGEQYNAKNILKQLNYEQTRDREIIRETNSRTTAIYGEYRANSKAERRNSYARHFTLDERDPAVTGKLEHTTTRADERDLQYSSRTAGIDAVEQAQDRKRLLDPADTDRGRQLTRTDHAARDISFDDTDEKNLRKLDYEKQKRQQMGLGR